MTGLVYLKVLQNDFMPHLEHINEEKPLWYVHDGALPHYVTIMQNYLNVNFEIGLGEEALYNGHQDPLI